MPPPPSENAIAEPVAPKPMRILSSLQSVLMKRRLPVFLAVLAMTLAAPSLWSGWVMDDHFHRLMLTGSDRFPLIFNGSWDMFRFMDGDLERTQRMMDVGTVPWWTYPQIVAQFWRPISTLTHKLDYLLWPESAALMHAQSLLWFGTLVFAVTILYRRLMGPTFVAGLAALLYAIDDAHAVPAGWIANRNGLVAALFGVLAIICHDKWRRDGWRAGWILGPGLLAMSLFAKEAGVAVAGYLFAYAVFLDRSAWRSRVLSLVPYAAVIAAWRIVWVLLGNGLHGVGLYIDPASDPLRFMVSMATRAPLLLFGQFALPPSDTFIIFDDSVARVAGVVFLVLLVGLGWLLAPCIRKDRVAQFFALGMICSLVPACATFPSDRLLSYIGIGAMGLIARFVQVGIERDAQGFSRRPRRFGTRPVVWLLVAVHLVISPLWMAVHSLAPSGPKWLNEQLHVQTPLDASVENQDVVIVNPPSVFHCMYLPVLRELSGRPVPRRTRALAPGAFGVSITRSDEHTLILTPGKHYLSWGFHRLFRNRNHPFAVGDRVELAGMTAEITGLSAASDPTEVAFHFDVPLEDASLRWLQYKDGEFVPFVPPRVGITVELPPAVPKFP
ncbi:MAG: hypothetical protein IH989_07785 [Planctomycetes bacterium]|nr:hypothetical protein [Planctomycetota bacterium]